MKGIAFISTLIILLTNNLYGQVMTEGLWSFEKEIKHLILKWDQSEYLEFSIKIEYQDKEWKKPFFLGRITYNLINDSVVKQTFYKPKQAYYGLIKNSEIIDYSPLKNEIIQQWQNGKVRDSTNYQFFIGKEKFGTDSVKYNTRCKFDQNMRIIEILKQYKNEAKKHLSTFEYEGDTITNKRRFKLINNDTILVYKCYERTSTFKKQKMISDTIIETRYSSNTARTDSLITKSHYRYNKKEQVSEIVKYKYYNNEKYWTEKSIMRLKYKSK